MKKLWTTVFVLASEPSAGVLHSILVMLSLADCCSKLEHAQI